MYRTIVDNVPTGTNATKGTLISDIIKIADDEKVIAVTSLHRTSMPKYAIFITKNGLFKKTYLEEYMNTKRNAGIAAMTVREGDSVVDIIFMDEEDMVIITKDGMSIRFTTSDINSVGRIAQGVKAIKLNDGDEVIAALPVHKETDSVAVFSENGVGKIIYLFCYTWMLIYIRYKNVFIKLYKSIVKMKHITGIGIIGLIVQNALLCFYFYKKYIVFKHNIITYNNYNYYDNIHNTIKVSKKENIKS